MKSMALKQQSFDTNAAGIEILLETLDFVVSLPFVIYLSTASLSIPLSSRNFLIDFCFL